jgi:hypothetical protein
MSVAFDGHVDNIVVGLDATQLERQVQDSRNGHQDDRPERPARAVPEG